MPYKLNINRYIFGTCWILLVVQLLKNQVSHLFWVILLGISLLFKNQKAELLFSHNFKIWVSTLQILSFIIVHRFSPLLWLILNDLPQSLSLSRITNCPRLSRNPWKLDISVDGNRICQIDICQKLVMRGQASPFLWLPPSPKLMPFSLHGLCSTHNSAEPFL